MTKPNKGNTTKLSIRLSTVARQKIEKFSKNVGISMAGVILFELTKLFKSPPSMTELDYFEETITLERNHFVMTVNDTLMEKINNMAEDYDMKKNILLGYIISAHFEKVTPRTEGKDAEPKKLLVQVNESLKKKMTEYSEENFIPLSILVTYCILEGPYEDFPSYESGETEQFFTNVPSFAGELVKEKAAELNMREHFYTSLCLYKQFMVPSGRFFE